MNWDEAKLHKAIAAERLEVDQNIARLIVFEGMTPTEVEIETGIPHETVRTRLYLIIRRWKKKNGSI